MSLATVWVSQAAAGLGDGTSKANAAALTFLTTAGNWGSGPAQIGPGTQVLLTGSITGAITLRGSGASGNPVVIDGSDSGCTVANKLNVGASGTKLSWLHVKNLTWTDGGGTGNANAGIDLWGTEDSTIEGCIINASAAANIVFLHQESTVGHCARLLIKNNKFSTTNADLGDTQHDCIASEGAEDIILEGNLIEQRTESAAGTSNAHNDCVQLYTTGSGMSGKIDNKNWTLRYNKIVMNSVETANRQILMWEYCDGTFHVHNNLFLGLDGAEGSNGIAINNANSPTVFNFYFNTIIAKSGTLNNLFNIETGGTMQLHGNIIFTGGSQQIFRSFGGMNVVRSNNLWLGTTAPPLTGAGVSNEARNVSSDPAYAQFINFASNDFRLAAASPARASTAASFGSPYNTYITGTASPTFPSPIVSSRNAGVAWTKGAFGAGVAAPSSLTVE